MAFSMRRGVSRNIISRKLKSCETVGPSRTFPEQSLTLVYAGQTVFFLVRRPTFARA
jgi:hypothetical protein